jgi:hypothetical protein
MNIEDAADGYEPLGCGDDLEEHERDELARDDESGDGEEESDDE